MNETVDAALSVAVGLCAVYLVTALIIGVVHPTALDRTMVNVVGLASMFVSVVLIIEWRSGLLD